MIKIDDREDNNIVFKFSFRNIQIFHINIFICMCFSAVISYDGNLAKSVAETETFVYLLLGDSEDDS